MRLNESLQQLVVRDADGEAMPTQMLTVRQEGHSVTFVTYNDARMFYTCARKQGQRGRSAERRTVVDSTS
jgi:hypothetical protein